MALADQEIAGLWAELRRLRAQVDAQGAELSRLAGAKPATVLPDGTLRRGEAAKLVGLSPATLNRMATRREGPPFIVFRGRAYYRLADLEKWRDENLRVGARDRPAPRRADPCQQSPLSGLAEA